MNKVEIDVNLLYEDELDCYQNLKMLLLENYGRNSKFMGACWPYEFQTKVYDNGIRGISDVECLKEEQFMRFFAVQYRDTTVAYDANIMNVIKESIDKNIPLIVSFDEYYSFYHYEHIFQKQHGDHAILVLGYDDDKEEISFFSAIPKYYGVMTYANFKNGIDALKERHIISITPDDHEAMHENDIWKEFIDDVKDIKAHYLGDTEKVFRDNNSIFVPQILNILEKVTHMEEEEAKSYLSNLLQGTWVWHVDRRARLTQKSINNSSLPEEFKVYMNEYFDSVIDKWVVACKHMFKISLSGKMHKLAGIVNSFNELKELDMKCFDKICELKI